MRLIGARGGLIVGRCWTPRSVGDRSGSSRLLGLTFLL